MNWKANKTVSLLLSYSIMTIGFASQIYADTVMPPEIKYYDSASEVVRAQTIELKEAQTDMIAQDFGEQIVFCLNDGVYVQFSNGTGRRRIIARGTGYSSFSYPAWSLDGTQIAWAAVRTDTRFVDLCLANADGSNPRAIFSLSTGFYYSFIQSISWSWDNQYIMFNHAYDDYESTSYFLLCTINQNGTGFAYVNDFTRSYSQYEPINGSTRYAYVSTGNFADANSRVHVSNLNGTNDITWFTYTGTIAGFTHMCWNTSNSVYTVIRWWSQYPNREVLLRIDRVNNQTDYHTIILSDPGSSLWSPTVSPDRRGLYMAELTATTSTLWLTTLDANGNVIDNQSKGVGFYPNWRQHIPPTGINDDNGRSLPGALALSQNYPNPFNAKTTISYDLPDADNVSIDIYDILGGKVESLLLGNQSAGSHSIIWDAMDMPSGTYFYKIRTGEFTETRKMLLLK